MTGGGADGGSLALSQLDPHYDSVVQGFRRGRVTPVLGAGVNLCGRPPIRGEDWIGHYPPSGAELALYLAKMYKYPSDQPADLIRVSQYVYAIRGGSGPLYESLPDLFDQTFPITPVHDFLAAVPEPSDGKRRVLKPPLIVTTNYDDLVEAAFAKHAVPFHLVVEVEEYFLYHADEEGEGTFADQFPEAVNLAGLPAGFLLSIREDALAKLDRFKTAIPGLFDTYLRVNHLDTRAAREAILRPVDEYNRRIEADREVTVENELVSAVVRQVRPGQVVLAQTGHGALQSTEVPSNLRDQIETPYLQLVVTRIWDREVSSGSRELRLATLNELGGAQEIVRTHLDTSLSNLASEERAVAADVFHHLVTPSGFKIAHAARDLAEYTGHPIADVERLLEKLVTERILRPVPPPLGEEGPSRFEIFHNVLAPAILDWRTRETQARLQRG